MPKSKKRGGEKAHRKRVQQKNNVVKAQQMIFQKEMQAKIEELRKQYESQSGTTQTEE